jgi:hypothetical protein
MRNIQVRDSHAGRYGAQPGFGRAQWSTHRLLKKYDVEGAGSAGQQLLRALPHEIPPKVGKAHDGGAVYSYRGSIHHDHLNCRSVFNDLSFQTLLLGTICAQRFNPLFDFRQCGSSEPS